MPSECNCDQRITGIYNAGAPYGCVNELAKGSEPVFKWNLRWRWT